MNKRFIALIFGLLLPLTSFAAKYEEGEQYEVISKTATDQPEVIEFFSFWCPHCFQFEPLVEQIKAKLDKKVEFNKVHVNFMRFTTPEIQEQATRAMMVAEALKKDDVLNKAVFNYIHVQRSPITSLKDLQNIFIVNGVDGDKFDKLANSFGVNNMVMRNNQNIEKYRKFVSGVPTFIVNGKYKAKFTKGMTPDDMVDLVVWLSEQK